MAGTLTPLKKAQPETGKKCSGFHRLFYVPIFLAGLAVFISSLWAPSNTKTENLLVDADSIFLSVEKAYEAGDIPSAWKRLRQVSVQHLKSISEAEVALLRGSLALDAARAQLSLDELSPAMLLTLAQSELERARRVGLPLDRQNHFAFQQALLAVQTTPGEESQTQLMQATEASGTDKEEGYAELARLALQPPLVDYDKALLWTEKVLALPRVKQVWKHRLKRAELLLKLRRFPEVEKLLTQLRQNQAIEQETLLLSARLYSQMQVWGKAVSFWEKVSDNAPLTFEDHLSWANSLHQVSRTREAITQLEQLRGKTRETRYILGIVFAQARWLQAIGDDEQGITAIRTLIRLSKGATLEEPAPTRIQIQQLVDGHFTTWLKAQKFDRARQLIETYRGYVLPDPSHAWLGYVWETEADVLQKKKAPPEELKRAFLQAGMAYDAAAKATLKMDKEESQNQLLWSAGQNFLRAEDAERAKQVLKQLLEQMPTQSKVPRDAVLVALGEACLRLSLASEAVTYFQKSLEVGQTLSTRARYLLGRAFESLDKRKEAEGEYRAVLDQERQKLRRGEAVAAEAVQAAYRLAHIHHQEKDVVGAVDYYKAALEFDPHDARAYEANYNLAEISLYQGVQLLRQKTMDERSIAWIQQALLHFNEVDEFFHSRKIQPTVTVELRNTSRETRFGIAECQLELGRRISQVALRQESRDHLQRAINLFESISAQYSEKAEGLWAMQHLTKAYSLMSKVEPSFRIDAYRSIERAEEWLKRMPEESLQPEDAASTRVRPVAREEWQKIFRELRLDVPQ